MEDMKKQMTKKITSILIMLIMLITLFPTRVTVQADDELATVSTGKYNDYEYRVNDKNEVIITKYSGTETDVVTPKVIDNKPVVGIGVNAFVCLCNLQTLTISEGVRFFEGILTDEDDNLKQINLPSTLSIGKISGSFITGCNGISGYCPALEDIFIAPGNPYLCKENGIIYDKNKTMVICSTPKTQLGSVVLPDTVNYIDDMAFNYNDTLTSIQIPDKVTYIGYWTFNNCTNLQYVNIPRSVKMIGQYAFHQTRIQSLYIPKEVGNVGIKGDVFSPCMGDGIKNIIVENGNPYFKVVDGALIYNNRIQLYASGNEQTSYTMPDYVTGIAWMAFCGAYNLKYISLSKRLEEIPYGAFDNCIHLKKIIIPEGIKKIDNNAFWNCYDLQKIGLPQSLTQIGNDVFANVYGKMDIYYPGSQSKWNSLSKGNSFDDINATYHFNFDLSNGFRDENEIKPLGYSVSLSDRVSMNVYMQVPDDIFDSMNAVVRFTYRDAKAGTRIVDKPITEFIRTTYENKDVIKMTCEVNIAELTSPVGIQTLRPDGTESNKCECCVQTYAKQVISDKDTYKDLVPVVEALMSYGSYAQKYFGVNTDNLADAGIDMSDMSETIETIKDDELSAKLTLNGFFTEGAIKNFNNEDFEYIGMSLVCGSAIDAKAYFSNKNNLSLEQIKNKYSIVMNNDDSTAINEENYEISADNSLICIKIKNIGPSKLYRNFHMYFTNKSNDETTSGVVRPYWYINKVIQSPTADADLKNLCKAMYIYNNAERQYFMNHIWDNWGRA